MILTPDTMKESEYQYVVPIAEALRRNDQQAAFQMMLDLVNSPSPRLPLNLYYGLVFLSQRLCPSFSFSEQNILSRLNDPLDVAVTPLKVFCTITGVFGAYQLFDSSKFDQNETPFGLFIAARYFFRTPNSFELLNRSAEMGYYTANVAMYEHGCILYNSSKVVPMFRRGVLALLDACAKMEMNPKELISKTHIPFRKHVQCYNHIVLECIPRDQLVYFMQLIPKRDYDEIRTFFMIQCRVGLLPKDVRHLVLAFINTK